MLAACGPVASVHRSSNATSHLLNEVASTRLLAENSIPVLRQMMIDIKSLDVPCDFEFPVVAKVVSGDLPHKSDVGGVQLSIRNASELQDAVRTILTNVQTAAPGARLEGVVVSEMVSDALEIILGVINDDVFGPTVLLGFGGTLAEVLHDRSYRIAPFDDATARSMIGELRGAALFGAIRGRAARDVNALAETVARISEIAWELRDELLELDINPLFVRAAGEGVVVGDALAVMID
jgi:hypothetical protein